MVQCKINLVDNARDVYYPGEVLKGSIELMLETPQIIRGLYLIVYGAARCHWTKTENEEAGRRTRTRIIHFAGEDVYLNSRICLFESIGTEIESGLHTYEFTRPLPEQIPSSFDTAYGGITYHIELIVDAPWNIDKVFKRQFTVVRMDDLNLQPDLKIATKSEEMGRFCCCCCESSPLFMTVTLPFSGYVPGQTINVTVNYVNKSGVRIGETHFELRRVVDCNSQTPQNKNKVEKMIIAIGNNEGVEPEESKTISEALTLPLILVNTNTTSSVVSLFYELEITARTEGCHLLDVSTIIPITIGSIPLNFEVPNMPLLAAVPPELPPPSFEEATKGTFTNSSYFIQPFAPSSLMPMPFEASGIVSASENPPNIGWNFPAYESTGSNKYSII